MWLNHDRFVAERIRLPEALRLQLRLASALRGLQPLKGNAGEERESPRLPEVLVSN